MWISAFLCVGAAGLALATIRDGIPIHAAAHPHPQHACVDYRAPS